MNGSCSKWTGAIFIADNQVAPTRDVIRPIDRRFILHRNPFPIGIYSQLNADMPELTLHVYDRFSLLKQERGVGMSKTMRREGSEYRH